MNLVIINCSPRTAAKSNTEMVIAAFCKGFEARGNTSELWHLSKRDEWKNARDAFASKEQILFALPLYVENVPGILLEFLQSLPKKSAPGTKVTFLIQGGFEEAIQAACAKAYVEMLPSYLGCDYAGTLTKGGLFGVNFLPEKMSRSVLEHFEDARREFAKAGCFSEKYTKAFAGPEHYSKAEIQKYELIGCHLSKFMMGRIARKLGCKEKLDVQPYKAAQFPHNASRNNT
ncbi:MAG: NAD(P)H-dependent oxidoreductase [Anaerostipes sp.]|nr:NAD(P)H-dependent oxidoreductase [Anaerostipes sp.]